MKKKFSIQLYHIDQLFTHTFTVASASTAIITITTDLRDRSSIFVDSCILFIWEGEEEEEEEDVGHGRP
jgi:hypothetical protein